MNPLTKEEQALLFAVQKYGANPTKKNESELIAAARNLVDATEKAELKEAANFFKDGEFNRGDRYTLANTAISKIQRFIANSMSWLDEVVQAYDVPIRS